MVFANGKLGASFFCSRGFAERSNLQVILLTLTLQLAYRYPSFRKELLQVLKAQPDVGRGSLCSQMEMLSPLEATNIPTLIVIEALDKCKDEKPASAILSVLSTTWTRSLVSSSSSLAIQNFSSARDIKLYFRTQLMDITKSRSDCDFAEDWPKSSDTDVLCAKAAGLFTYASTVVKFVAFRYQNPLNSWSGSLDFHKTLPTKEAPPGLTSFIPRS